MSQCTIDHSLEDVIQKLENQKAFLPEALYSKCRQFLSETVGQARLNEVFHLLKKYDLASTEEKETRNAKLEDIV